MTVLNPDGILAMHNRLPWAEWFSRPFPYAKPRPNLLAPLGGSEMVDRALDPVALACGLHRVNFVVVGCPRLKIIEAYAEGRR